jgi:hypothetical protein
MYEKPRCAYLAIQVHEVENKHTHGHRHVVRAHVFTSSSGKLLERPQLSADGIYSNNLGIDDERVHLFIATQNLVNKVDDVWILKECSTSSTSRM